MLYYELITLFILLAGLLLLCGGKKQPQPQFQFKSASTEQRLAAANTNNAATQQPASGNGSNKREGSNKMSSEGLRPHQHKLNEKEKLIAKGATKNPSEYPTFDDVPSDWEDKDGKMAGDKKKEKEEKEKEKEKEEKEDKKTE